MWFLPSKGFFRCSDGDFRPSDDELKLDEGMSPLVVLRKVKRSWLLEGGGGQIFCTGCCLSTANHLLKHQDILA